MGEEKLKGLATLEEAQACGLPAIVFNSGGGNIYGKDGFWIL
jgi:glycosyltransferase involved in cell wall biosynthesis